MTKKSKQTEEEAKKEEVKRAQDEISRRAALTESLMGNSLKNEHARYE